LLLFRRFSREGFCVRGFEEQKVRSKFATKGGQDAMPAHYSMAWALALVAVGLAGCNSQGPFLNSTQANGNVPPQAAWEQQQASRLQDLGRRATALDVDNRDLHTQLAQANQQAKLHADENELLRGRLNETASQLREFQVAKVKADRQLSALEATTTRGGSARITANNSLQDSLPAIDIPGIQVRPDDDVIRIELPADRLFHQGTSQLLPAATTLLDQIAGVTTRNYPRQVVGIEGHTDSVPAGATSSHQLSVAQSTAVFDALTLRGRYPAQQLFIVGYGANRPTASNATPAGRTRNRRIEIVIYPETADGS
jgi:flagellar motor protein MotB